jgi:ferredoxin
MKASVDEKCIGCGLCPQICPEVFEMNDANLAIVKLDPVPPEFEESCREATASCPVEAIQLTD